MSESRRRRRGGFTLLEMIVVVAIIGILATLAAVKLDRVLENARRTKIKHDLRVVVESASIVHTRTGSYPESYDELVEARDESGKRIAGPFESDPWGQPYGYELSDGEPTAFCLGKDGVEGGENEDTDYYYPRSAP